MSELAANNPLDLLDVFWTELSPNRAVVYARLTGHEYRADWRLTGTIRGPHSARHETLPATIAFQDLGPGPTQLARAVVPDPSDWSPQAPNVYQIIIELHREGSEPLRTERRIGFKPIRAAERYLLREGKTWVPRGVLVEWVSEADYLPVREHQPVLVLPSLTEPTLEWASQQGAYVAVRFSGTTDAIARDLRRFAAWPAAWLAIIDCAAGFDYREVAPNLVLAQVLQDECRLQPWCQALWAADSLGPAMLRGCLGLGKPTLVYRNDPRQPSLLEVRASCDALQRDLAPIGQFAGYFVESIDFRD